MSSFFKDLMKRDEDDVAVVLTIRHLSNLRDMLGSLPFKDADPIYREIEYLASAQLFSGLRDSVQAAVKNHRAAEALAAVALPDNLPN